jgi:hypothetical protein
MSRFVIYNSTPGLGSCVLSSVHTLSGGVRQCDNLDWSVKLD